jgi:hypothetical protein
LRQVTAIQPSWSLRVPYSAMWRRKPSALLAALPSMPHTAQVSSPPAAPPNFAPAVAAVSAKMQATTLAMPFCTAMAAASTQAPAVAPPMTRLPE